MGKLRKISERRPWLGTMLEVAERFREIRGPQLVNTIALRAFLSIFPLLIVAIAVLGFVAANNEDLAADIIDRLKLSGDLERMFTENLSAAQRSRKAASVVGLISLTWSGLGVIAAVAAALDAVWQVPGRGAKDKLLGVIWLVGAVLIGAAAGVASFIVQFVRIPVAGLLFGLLVSAAVGALLFWWAQWLLTNVNLAPRAFWPGAAIGGVALAVFQIGGTYVLGYVLASASELYASLAAVIALITLFSILAWLLVMSAVVNVVLWERTVGTVTLMVQAPALPAGTWAVAERGGQRPKVKRRVTRRS